MDTNTIELNNSRPVIGIMALYWNDRKQLEERALFRKFMTAGRRLGLSVIVFTPEDVDHSLKRVLAHAYDHKLKKWKRVWTSLPDIIFDRCRYQPTKRFEQLKKFRQRYADLTYLNRPLANKWYIHQLFMKDEGIKPYLPDTVFYNKVDDVTQMLKKHDAVFFKPVNGTGGRGILRIQQSNGSYVIQGRNHQRGLIAPKPVQLTALKSILNTMQGEKKYEVQQGIHITLPSGRVHDYRILLQKNHRGKWSFTGGACRIGPLRSVTSNLHGGGSALPMLTMLRRKYTGEQVTQIQKHIQKLSHHILQRLEKNYGSLCEMALDIAIDPKGDIWLLEINPKPGREVFYKIGQKSVYQKSIQRPMEYAKYVYANRQTT
ncbi:YheC/YheD family endospore coat-associated protein [Marinicrinis sediminis]|uniref:YheC/YheD family protein n=1 Tax=Marinicrinis sediminis TaxID=1652465 RepID=A0ABW5R9L1_9BACL